MTDAEDGKLTLEQAQVNWQDLSPEALATAMAAVDTLDKIAAILPTLTEDQKTTVRIEQEAAKQKILKAGRRKADAIEAVEIFHESRRTANSGVVDLRAMMDSPPEGYEERVWDPVSKQVLMRRGQIGSLAGPDKGGKTRIAVSLMSALLDPSGGTPFLGYYCVAPLREDQVVVHIALEEDNADLYGAWGPYLREHPDRADRVVAISYSGVNVNMTATEIRDEVARDIWLRIETMEEKAGHDLHIGAIVIDPLFAMAQGDYNKDPRLATDVFNQVLKAWCKDQLGAEVVLVLAHTSREGGRMGSEGSIYGSIGWASKMHFLWYVLKDQKQDDYRIFGANRGRADTYAFPQRLYMLTEDEDSVKFGQVEVRPEEGEEAAQERSNGRVAGSGYRGPSKMAVLKDKLTERMMGVKDPVMARTLIDELQSEAGRLEVAGVPVTFASSKASVSKVLKQMVEDGTLDAVDLPDPTRKDHTTPAWKWSTATSAGAAGSLMPPSRGSRETFTVKENSATGLPAGTVVDRNTGEIIGTVPGEQVSTPDGSGSASEPPGE